MLRYDDGDLQLFLSVKKKYSRTFYIAASAKRQIICFFMQENHALYVSRAVILGKEENMR